MGGMIVPQYWAEARLRERTKRGQLTVLRWGWSDESQEKAQAHADQRTRDALNRIVAGEKLLRRENRVAYNGADGVPIREEILSRHGETIITRNSYGAHCLNTPDVLFADVDCEQPRLPYLLALGIVLACAAGAILSAPRQRVAAGCVSIPITLLTLAIGWRVYLRIAHRVQAKPEVRALERIRRALQSRPTWSARVYRSPAGYRVLVSHQLFDPAALEVEEFFRDLGSDPVYVRMCLRQRCFRARVSPKPWRIGIGKHLRPSPGVWPVGPDRISDRKRWVEAYEAAAVGYASCRFEESLGSSFEDPTVAAVRELHDELSRALTALPIA